MEAVFVIKVGNYSSTTICVYKRNENNIEIKKDFFHTFITLDESCSEYLTLFKGIDSVNHLKKEMIDIEELKKQIDWNDYYFTNYEINLSHGNYNIRNLNNYFQQEILQSLTEENKEFIETIRTICSILDSLCHVHLLTPSIDIDEELYDIVSEMGQYLNYMPSLKECSTYQLVKRLYPKKEFTEEELVQMNHLLPYECLEDHIYLYCCNNNWKNADYNSVWQVISMDIDE